MNKKWTTLIIVFCMGLMFITVGALKAGEVAPPPDEVMIENEGYKTDKKGPVKLTHKKHNEEYKVACTDCHHDYQDGKKNVWTKEMPVKKCKDCHDPKETVKKGDAKIYKLNLGYHKNCKTCHKKIVKEDPAKKAPFKKCTGCHQKKG